MKIKIYGNYVFSVFIRKHIFVCEFDFISNSWQILDYKGRKTRIVDYCVNRISCVHFLDYVYGDNELLPF